MIGVALTASAALAQDNDDMSWTHKSTKGPHKTHVISNGVTAIGSKTTTDMGSQHSGNGAGGGVTGGSGGKVK
jgi:hypothetical protein